MLLNGVETPLCSSRHLKKTQGIIKDSSLPGRPPVTPWQGLQVKQELTFLQAHMHFPTPFYSDPRLCFYS